MSSLQRFAFGCTPVLSCLLLFLLGPEDVCAQSDEAPPVADSTTEERWVPSVRSVGRNAVNIARAPLQLNSTRQLLMVGATGVALGGLLSVDAAAHGRVSARSGPAASVSNRLAGPGRVYDRVGPDRMALGTAGVLATTGLLLDKKSFTRTSVRVVESLVYTNLVTGALKSLIGRSRPGTQDGPFSVNLDELERDHGSLSMPSGHTARAFAFASVLAHQADRWYVSVPAYGVATSVGIERIHSGDHWMSDVVVGGVLGYLIGRSVTNDPRSSTGPQVRPLLSPDRIGLSIHF